MTRFALVLLLLLGLAAPAGAHPVAVGKTAFHDGVDKHCTLADANAAPLSAPDAAHPWGTVVTGCFRGQGDSRRAVVKEWDLFHGKTVHEATFAADGHANQIRVAAGGGRVVAVVSAATEGPVDHTWLRLLDDKLSLVRKWDLGVGGFVDVDASGKLAAVLVNSWGHGLALRTLDMAHAKLLAKRVFRLKHVPYPALFYPSGVVRVGGKHVYVAFAEARDTKAYRLSSRLRISGGYAQHAQSPLQATSAAFLAIGAQRVVLGSGEGVDVLAPWLAKTQRLAAPPLLRGGQPARWAIDAATGRVATEDGRVAAHVGAPFKRVLDFTHEVVSRGLKLEVRADQTRAVLWAFGRVVIVRDAPGLGIVAFDAGPASGQSSPTPAK